MKHNMKYNYQIYGWSAMLSVLSFLLIPILLVYESDLIVALPSLIILFNVVIMIGFENFGINNKFIFLEKSSRIITLFLLFFIVFFLWQIIIIESSVFWTIFMAIMILLNIVQGYALYCLSTQYESLLTLISFFRILVGFVSLIVFIGYFIPEYKISSLLYAPLLGLYMLIPFFIFLSNVLETVWFFKI